MNAKKTTLQDAFLDSLRKEQVPVSVFLVNGIKLVGQIESFDQYVVLLKSAVTQAVYKHAISTVVPSQQVANAFPHAGESNGTRRAETTGGVHRTVFGKRGDYIRGA